MSAQETVPELEIEDDDLVKFIQDYEDCYGHAKVKVGTTGKVVATHQSGVYKGRFDVKLDDETIVKQVPSAFLELLGTRLNESP